MRKIKVEALEKEKEVDIRNNKHVNLLINIVSGIFLLLGLILSLIFVPFNIFVTFQTNTFIKVLVLLVGLFFYFAIHELLHALFYKIFTREKVLIKFHVFTLSSECPRGIFFKYEYAIIALAPVILLFIGLFIATKNVDADWLWILTALQIENIAGAVPDFYLVKEIFNGPEKTLINDDGDMLRFMRKKIEKKEK